MKVCPPVHVSDVARTVTGRCITGAQRRHPLLVTFLTLSHVLTGVWHHCSCVPSPQEWRHQNGMRALGIPNNKNFFEVTKIDDALALWRDIQVHPEGFDLRRI